MASTREHEWDTFFQGHNASLGNFYKCEIMATDGKQYTSTEQYYCSLMAKHHKEFDTAWLIEATDNLYSIKSIIWRIWYATEWNCTNEKVLEDVITAKFEENLELKRLSDSLMR